MIRKPTQRMLVSDKQAYFIRLGPKTNAALRAQCPESLSPTAFCTLLIEQGLTGDANLPAYCVGAGHQNRFNPKLPLKFPPGLEVTSSSPPTEAVQAVPDQGFDTARIDTGVISKKPRAKKTKGCDEFETFWKTYTAFEHRANKQDKPKALAAWKEATKEVTPDQLLEALTKAHDEIVDHVANQTFYSSMPDCFRWLKGECYSVYLEGNTTVQSNSNIW